MNTFLKSMKKSNLLTVSICILIVIEVIMISIILLKLHTSLKYNDHITLGDKYFKEMDYENAELHYIAAIKINKKEVVPYINLSHVYIATEHYDEAYEILQSAKDHVKKKDHNLITEQERHLEEVKKNASGGTGNTPKDDAVTATFEEFASQYTYFSNENRDGNVKYVLYLTKNDWLQVNYLSIQPLTYTIHDFDHDGKDELFIMDIASDYTMVAKMYEEHNGEVVLSSELKLETDIKCEAEDGEMQCIYYDQDGRTVLAVTKVYNASHFSDGIFTKFTNFYYDGTNLISIGSAEYVGSSFDPNYPPTEYIALGIPADISLLERGNFLDYLPSPTVFGGSKTVCYVDYNAGERFYDSSLDSMDVSYIEFY